MNQGEIAIANNCKCEACLDLLAECGEDKFNHYRKKLFVPGWAGVKSPVERRYLRTHRVLSDKQRIVLEEGRLNLHPRVRDGS